MDHPSEEILKRFAAGRASREESREVVAHLVKGCALCATRLKRLMEVPRVAGAAYDPALDHFDQEMIGSLESTVDPLQTLRDLLKGAQPRLAERAGAKKRG